MEWRMVLETVALRVPWKMGSVLVALMGMQKALQTELH